MSAVDSRMCRFSRPAAHREFGAGKAGSVGRPLSGEVGYADGSHLYRRANTMTDPTPVAVAQAPWPAIGDIA